jgi:hypothetical protein
LPSTQERTEETYVQWIRRYILFDNKRHPKSYPKKMGFAEIEAFLGEKGCARTDV